MRLIRSVIPFSFTQYIGVLIALTPLFLAAISTHHANAQNKKDLPESAQQLFSAVDALLEADQRPAGITPAANVARIKPLMQRVVDAGEPTYRGELNSFYPELGDHFLDDAVTHARFILKSLDSGDDDDLTRAGAAIFRWQKWWGTNKRPAMAAIYNRFG